MNRSDRGASTPDYLAGQLLLHRSMRPRDMIKLCYQAAFGAEHLLGDPAVAQAHFEREFASATDAAQPLYESISPDCCRVNLSAWKARGLPSAWLFRLFAESATKMTGSQATFERLLREADALCAAGRTPFPPGDWAAALGAYWRDDGGAVHHSESYRAAERPAYRLVNAAFIRLFPLLAPMAQKGRRADGVCTVALDGRAASGKTTMAGQLALVTGAGVVHMDDFFLPETLRTPARLNEPGGNVHYERFAQEVLPRLARPEAFSYRRFDCAVMDFGAARTVDASSWRVVEGAYSCHPFFGNYANISVFCDVAPDEQLRRIALRNGPEKARMFAERWIPLEERYLAHCGIVQRAAIVL